MKRLILLLLLGTFGLARADTKISALPAASTPADGDVLATVQTPGGVPTTTKITLAQIKAYMGTGTAGLTTLGNLTTPNGTLPTYALPSGSSIIVLGDSLSIGTNGTPWEYYLSLRFSTVPIYSFGIGGTTAGPLSTTTNSGLAILAASSPAYTKWLNGATTTGNASISSLVTATTGKAIGIFAYGANDACNTAIFTTGNITSGSSSLTSVGQTVSNSLLGFTVIGTGIPDNTTITAVSGSTLTLSANATATTTGLPIAIQITLPQFTGALQSLYSIFHAYNSNTLVIGTTITASITLSPVRQIEWNGAIRVLGAPFATGANSWDRLADPFSGIPNYLSSTFYSYDHLHLSSNGYRQYAFAIENALTNPTTFLGDAPTQQLYLESPTGSTINLGGGSVLGGDGKLHPVGISDSYGPVYGLDGRIYSSSTGTSQQVFSAGNRQVNHADGTIAIDWYGDIGMRYQGSATSAAIVLQYPGSGVTDATQGGLFFNGNATFTGSQSHAFNSPGYGSDFQPILNVNTTTANRTGAIGFSSVGALKGEIGYDAPNTRLIFSSQGDPWVFYGATLVAGLNDGGGVSLASNVRAQVNGNFIARKLLFNSQLGDITAEGTLQGANLTVTGLSGIVQANGSSAATAVTIGSGLTLSSGTLSVSGAGSGTVTSFSAGSLSPLFTTSVATATTTPALSFTLTSAAQNKVLAGPTSGSGAPTYRSLVAADVPTLNQSTTGTAANVTGTVAVANGGTGTTTPALVAGSNVTITGTWPNQTIAAATGGNPVPVRQTVLSGPIDANGAPSFLPATSASLGITAQNVTSSAPLVVAAAGGFGTTGAVNRIGQTVTNPVWSSFTGAQTVSASTSTTTTVTISTGSAHNLIVGAEVNLTGFVPTALNGRWIVATVPTSTTFTFTTPSAAGATTTIGTYTVSNFLYVDAATDGSLTAGNNLLPPIYQQGGTRSIVSGQFTFNVAEMYASIGNGTTATQTYRVYVGEVQCNATTVTSSAAYAYQGFSLSALNSTLPGTSALLTSTDNLGVAEKTTSFELVCTGAEYTYLPGDIVTNVSTQIVAGNAFVLFQFWNRRTNSYASTGGVSGVVIMNSGTYASLTAGKWSYRTRTRRNW